MIPASRRFTASVLIPAIVILAAGWLAYGPSLHGGWLWDDTEEVTQNAVLRDPAGLQKIWFAPAGTDYLPLKSSVQWLEWRAWGSDPAGYHAVNLTLHLLSAFLFWRLLAKLGLRHASVGGLLLAVHPLAVESVAWVAELKNTLSLPLLLLAMLAYVAADEGRAGRSRPAARSVPATANAETNGYLLLSFLCFLLAMLSKSSVVMFPVVILLYAWWKRGRITRRDAAVSVPFFVISLGLGLVTVWFQQHRAIIAGHQLAGGLAERVAAAGLALAFYLGKSLWPFGLLPIYPRWEIHPSDPLVYAPWLVLAALIAWCWSQRGTWGRHVLFGLGFFVLNLAPVLGLVAMSYLRISRVADHFVYLPLLGIIGLVTAGIDRLLVSQPSRPNPPAHPTAYLGRAGRSRPAARLSIPPETDGASGRAQPPGPTTIFFFNGQRSYLVIATWASLAVVALAFVWQTRRYAEIFRNEEALWSYTIKHNPGAWAAQGNLGYALFQAGRVSESIPYYREALRLNPDYAEARYNLGTALLQINQVPEAIAEYERAVRLQPASAGMQNNLGTALVHAGRLPEAAGHFAQAVQLDPDYAEAHHNLGNALLLTGRLPEAIQQYQETLRLSPTDTAAKAALEMAERALPSRR